MASVEWVSGTPPQAFVYPEGGSNNQAFKAGDLVKFVSGKVEIATSGAIDGIARTDANGDTDEDVVVELINLDSVYTARYTASATAQTLVGDILDFTFTLGAHVLDESGATTDVVCVQLDPRDPVTTSGGRLYVKFLAGATLQA
jgi:hypothetical protein